MAVASRSCSRTMIDGHCHMAPIRSNSPLISVGSSKSLHFLGHGALVDDLEMRKCATHWVKMTSKSGQMHRRLQRNDIDTQMMLNDHIIYIYLLIYIYIHAFIVLLNIAASPFLSAIEITLKYFMSNPSSFARNVPSRLPWGTLGRMCSFRKIWSSLERVSRWWWGGSPGKWQDFSNARRVTMFSETCSLS